MSAFRDALDALAPWDAIPYFEEPTEASVLVLANSIAILCQANVRRVALIFHVAASGTVNVGFKPLANLGITCASTLPPTELHFSDYGTLVQKQWTAFNPGAQPVNVTVYEIVLLRWPGAADQIERRQVNGAQGRGKQRQRNGR